MEKFTRYANLTDSQKKRISDQFEYARWMGSDPGHAAACAAASGLGLTDKQWNSKIGADAFAATLAALVMAGKIGLTYTED